MPNVVEKGVAHITELLKIRFPLSDRSRASLRGELSLDPSRECYPRSPSSLAPCGHGWTFGDELVASVTQVLQSARSVVRSPVESMALFLPCLFPFRTAH